MLAGLCGAFRQIVRAAEVNSCSAAMSERKRNLKRKAEPLEGPEKPPAARGAHRAAGWLQEKVAEARRNSAEFTFNLKRLRFLSEAQRVRQGRGAVLYWMARDQRVQGNYFKQQQ